MTKVLTDQRSIRIKGRSFLAVVLSPESPVDQWLERLDDLAARSAGFFLSRPVVLDVSELSLDKAGLKELLAALTERNVGIMGIEGVRPSMIEPRMPPSLKGGKPASDVEVEPVAIAAELPEEKPRAAGEVRAVVPSLVINEPVRSGQSIMFPEGDVTVIGSVASGAEIIAGGSVVVSRGASLTSRERDVLRGLAEGLSTKEIAVRLGITVNTVRTHVQHLMPKLGVHTRLHAAAIAAVERLVDESGEPDQGAEL